MNVKINAKNMKYRLLFVVVYSIPFFSVEAQGGIRERMKAA